MRIDLLMLGTGTPYLRPHRCGSSTLIEIGQDKILIDLGYGSVRRLGENQRRLQDIESVLFTHHHYDHNVDYPSLVLHSRRGRERPLNVYGPVGTEELSYDLFTRGFHRDIQHRQSPEYNAGIVVSQVEDIDSGFVLEKDDWKLTARRADHFNRNGNYSLCYRIDTDHGSVVFSGDTIPCDGIREIAKGADMLIHEVYWRPELASSGQLPYSQTDSPDELWQLSRNQKHSLPDEVRQIAHEAGVQTLVLTHLFDDTHLDELHGYMQQGLDCEVVLAADHMGLVVN